MVDTSETAAKVKRQKKKQRAAFSAAVLFREKEKRDRARVNSRVVTSADLSGVERLQARRKSLMAKAAQGRRTEAVHRLAPGGTMQLHHVPGRADYPYGEEGEAA